MDNTSISAITANTNTVDTMDQPLPPHFCRLCEITLDSSEAQRKHAKSEWHVYKLRCRVAEPGTIVLEPSADQSNGCTHQSEEEFSSGETEYEEIGDSETWNEAHEFIPTQCLFCGTLSENFSTNITHMLKAHSFIIPHKEALIVELETLVWYLHMTIYSFHECIFCGSRRGTLEAAQQHMLGKGHCRFDVCSEIGEFYDSSIIESQAATFVRPDEASLRLLSGKLITHRSHAHASRPHPSHQSSEQAQQLSIPLNEAHGLVPGPSNALQRRDQKSQRLAIQLSQLRASDQQGLMHLSTSEQRSLLATRKKQLDKAMREERRMWSKVELWGNKGLMKHFKNDVPGRLNG